MIQGKDLILSLNGTPLAASTTCQLTTNTDFIEVCNPTSGEWRDYIPTILSWDVSAGCLIATMEHFNDLLLLQKQKQRIELSFYDAGIQVSYFGEAYIKKLDLTGTYGNLAKMSVGFQPCGELKIQRGMSIKTDSFLTENAKMIWAVSGAEYVYVQDQTDSNDIFYYLGYMSPLRSRLQLKGDCVVLNVDVNTFRNAMSDYFGNDNFDGATHYINQHAILYARPNEIKNIVLEADQNVTILRHENKDNLFTLQAN